MMKWMSIKIAVPLVKNIKIPVEMTPPALNNPYVFILYKIRQCPDQKISRRREIGIEDRNKIFRGFFEGSLQGAGFETLAGSCAGRSLD